MHSVGTPARRGFGARALGKLGRLIVIIALLVAVAVPLGFLWFVSQISSREVALTRNADGIVVLTGGASRVNDAFELLASKRGRRLLISGVYPATNRGEISRVLPEYERLFACCVDLDRTAVNTLGNAIGTKRWAQAQGFRSLIVVTSAYHMPRALAELAHQLPGVEFVPYPVVSERLRTEPWWSHIATAKLLFSEYVKYIVAAIRIRLDRDSDPAMPSRFSDLRLRLSKSGS
jgi:uncharacterized SAM-binding protein YcdF (DUF218 family)